MAKLTRTRGGRQMTSVGLAKIQLSPTLNGAWRVRWSYTAFGSTEYRNGPSGLGQFVAAQLFWSGVNTADEAEVVRFLADPPKLEEGAEIPNAFERLGITIMPPTAELLGSRSVESDAVAKIAAGENEFASIAPADEEAFCKLFEDRPGDNGRSNDWRAWFSRAREVPVVIKPRGFTIPSDDPLSRAYDLTEVPTTGTPASQPVS